MSTVNGTSAPVYDGIREGAAELALRRHGFTGERLLRLARKMANEYCTANVPYIGDKREDLVSSLVEVGLLAATRYDPAKTNGGDHFEGWLCKIMTHRCKDFFRKKSEGFGDRRYGNDNRIFLAGDTLDDEPDSDVDFGELISQRRVARWQAAAKLTDWSFEEFVVITLDKAALQLERAA